jgi:hypothetical protein
MERYTPSDFCSNFSLSITYDDPRTLREEMDVEISIQIMYCLDSPDLKIICHC